MTVLYIILALLGLFILTELLLFLAAFGGRTNADFTRHNFFFKKELRPYADLILAGKKYAPATASAWSGASTTRPTAGA